MGQGQADFTVATPAATGASNGLEFETETGTCEFVSSSTKNVSKNVAASAKLN